MKHNLEVTIVLILLFLAAQFIGLIIINRYNVKELPYDIQRPELDKETSYISVFVFILIGTGIAILISRFAALRLWKFWFFMSVLFTLIIGFGAFFNEIIAGVLALLLTILKIFKRGAISHNLSELFIYGGLAAIFVPLFSVLSISILLVLISVYDYIAVFKTKHMISLAKFQAKMKLFAGFLVPYGKKQAILGGGDIGFPLIFSGVVYLNYGVSALVIPLFTGLSLLALLILSKKNKFYPAMPFITVGCFLGLLVVVLIN